MNISPRLRSVAVLSALAVSAAGCGGGNSSADADAHAQGGAAARYGSVVELRSAAVDAGYICPHWKQDNVVTLAAESGHCSAGDVFSTYATAHDVQQSIDAIKSIDRDMAKVMKPQPHLVGPNWMVTAPKAKLEHLRAVLGGTIVQVS